MAQYRYAVVYHHQGNVWRAKGPNLSDQDQLLDILNEAGSHGWTVVGVGNFAGDTDHEEILMQKRIE